MDRDEIILVAIRDLSHRMEHRFDKVDHKFSTLENRTDKVERDILRVKTAGGLVGAVLAFIGWEHVKSWTIALTK